MNNNLTQKEILDRAEWLLKNKSLYKGKCILKKDLPTKRKETVSEEKVISETTEALEKKYNFTSDFTQGIFYFLSELTINVPEHAQAPKAFLKIFEIKEENKIFLEFLIKDNGIGIKNSFLENKIFVKDDLEALKEALKGISAKNKKSRGFGLRTSKRIVQRAFKGNFLLFSGKAVFWSNDNEEFFLNSKFNFQGTAINCLIPLTKEKINIYKFIE